MSQCGDVMQPVATFLGKLLYVYDPKLECTEKNFEEYAKSFNLLETLRSLCNISCQMFPNTGNLPNLGSVPLRHEILFELAYRVIKYCDRLGGQGMNENDLEYALRMCYKLSESTMKYDNNVELIAGIAYRQFVFQEKQLNYFARNYHIYTEIWRNISNAGDVDILSEIESVIGVPFDVALLYAFALLGNKDGHFWLYDDEAIATLNDKTNLGLTVASFKKFIEWSSADYETILSEATCLPPFMLHPIVRTNARPVDNKDEVYMLVSKQYLHDKLTSGLYFTLMDRFNKGGSKNQFKQGFGIAFQQYVGELLRYYFKAWDVVSEIRYKKGKHHFQDTVDWFLHLDDRLIMIEVKQSSIYSKAKRQPTIKGLKSDLQKTIIQGGRQLRTSEDDIKSNRYPELKRFAGVKSFLKLIVVNDAFYVSNFIVKSVMTGELEEVDYQVINVNDLEVLLSNQGAVESLFDILYYKRLNDSEMDFKEYIVKMFKNPTSSVKFLETIWDNFFKKLNLEGVPPLGDTHRV